ncbi:MAG: DUF1800 domain-containing protein [Burkholderiales bacterium]|nr:DUF1800 domain-containing protein [Burkholderiales bacterium]
MSDSNDNIVLTPSCEQSSVSAEHTADIIDKQRISWSAAVTAAAVLSACGGGTSVQSASGQVDTNQIAAAPPALNAAPISDIDASRFLAQASMGANRAEISRVQALGYAGWLSDQFSMPLSTSRWDWLVAHGYDALSYRNSQAGFDSCAWKKLISAPDTLRQRITLALSEIIVVAIDGLIGGGWKAFAGAAFLDMLEANCFANYRTLLGLVSTSPAMGEYLTFRGNTKYDPKTGALPDENYAREIMQLFSIGLLQLNIDGTPKLINGVAQETYSLDDITGLARIFTGWDFDLAGGKANTPDFMRRPMIQVASRHETGASSFLGSTVPAGLNGTDSLNAALDIIFSHPNVAPFISKQLIQRLVTSNPSAAYVTRVANIFNNDGKNVKGNLQAVITAILLDSEARNQINSTSNVQTGKLREPMLRFIAWARAYNVSSPSDAWSIGNTSDPATRLGQSPSRSPSVFNFFRPGYVPPNTGIATAHLVAPEFQLANESSVVGYVNFMQRIVSKGIGDLKPDYSSLSVLADDATALLNEINTVLAAGQLSEATLFNLRNAVGTMPSGTDARRNNRIYAALTLVLAAPEFIVLK